MKLGFFARACGVSAAVLMTLSAAHAGLVTGFMADKNGQAVPDAVFYLTPLDAAGKPAGGEPIGAKGPQTLVINQENYQFQPYVTVVRKGTSVKFTNKDGRDHHVKSFSPTKVFEMRVGGKGDGASTVLLDKPGDIALVCHFHDYMRAFIYVVEAPYFGITDKAGNIVFNNLPAGKYAVNAWVPTMWTPPFEQVVTVADTGPAQVRFKLDFVPKPQPPGKTPVKAPMSGPDYSY